MGIEFGPVRIDVADVEEQKMTFVLGSIAVVFCMAMAIQGHLVALIFGGVIGSFFGLAGFGGAVSGMLPGAVVGAILAVALKRRR